MSVWFGTLVFVAIAIALTLTAPLWAKKQSGLVQTLVLTCIFCMWLSWVLVYMSQMNPLLLPTRNIKKE